MKLTSAPTDAPTGAVEGDGDIFVTSRAWVSGFTAQIPVTACSAAGSICG